MDNMKKMDDEKRNSKSKSATKDGNFRHRRRMKSKLKNAIEKVRKVFIGLFFKFLIMFDRFRSNRYFWVQNFGAQIGSKRYSIKISINGFRSRI